MGHKLFIPHTYARFGVMQGFTPTGEYNSGGAGVLMDQIAIQVIVVIIIVIGSIIVVTVVAVVVLIFLLFT